MYLPNCVEYIRDAKGAVVDLVYKNGLVTNLIEIKSGMTINDDFFTGLSKLGALFLENNMKIEKFIIYSGDHDFEKKETRIINFKNLVL